MEQAKALVSTGELAVPYLKYDATQLEESRAACAYALGHIGGEDALRLLEDYGADPSNMVLRILWDIWSILLVEERTTFAQRILSQTQSIGISGESILRWKQSRSVSIRGHTSLDELRYCTRLTSLSLDGCEQITDLSPSARLAQLYEVRGFRG